LHDGRVRFVKGDGRLGWKEGAPWDAIVSFL
jgi:protein-L-isoaspartate O-methyltransferase